MPKDQTLYLPVLVGADTNYKIGIEYQCDNQGENISNKNPNYNELTGMYWAWKNLDADVVGLVHYRRYFSLHHKRSLGNVLTKQEVIQLTQDVPLVLPRKRKYFIETNYSHYVHAHHKEPLDIAGEIIREKFPMYSDAFELVMKRRHAHMFNMFIMKKSYFLSYSNWIFTILFELENRVDISQYSKQEARVFGYVSELLMDVWVEANHVPFSECGWIQLGRRNLIKKSIAFLMRKFKLGKAKTHF